MATPINAKFMEEKLKHGWTTSQISQKLDLTEERLVELIKSNFSTRAANDLLSRLKKNDNAQKKKDNRGKKRSAKIDEGSSEEAIVKPTSQDTILKVTANKEVENTPCDAEDIPDLEEDILNSIENTTNPEDYTFNLEIDSSIPVEEQLKFLYTVKEDTQNCILKLEESHKNISAERAKIKDEICSYSDKLSKLKEEVEHYINEINRMSDEYKINLNSMRSLSASISNQREKLNYIENKIISINPISILVSNDGTFKFDTSSAYAVEIPDYSEFLNKFLTSEDINIESLPLKSLKTLAKCLALTHKLEAEDKKYIIKFEDKNFENIFMIISNFFKNN